MKLNIPGYDIDIIFIVIVAGPFLDGFFCEGFRSFDYNFIVLHSKLYYIKNISFLLTPKDSKNYQRGDNSKYNFKLQKGNESGIDLFI